MAAVSLTLHQGESQATYVEHPIETASKALLAAVKVEDGSRVEDHYRRFAGSLLHRGAMKREVS